MMMAGVAGHGRIGVVGGGAGHTTTQPYMQAWDGGLKSQLTASQAASQSVSQSVSQSASQSASQPVSQTASRQSAFIQSV